MAYGAECWAVRNNYENILHVAEMRMLRWIRSKTRKDHVRNQVIQDDANVCQMSTFLRQKILNICTDTSGEEKKTISRKMMDMVVPGKRRKGRPRRRWFVNNREDINKYELSPKCEKMFVCMFVFMFVRMWHVHKRQRRHKCIFIILFKYTTMSCTYRYEV